MPWVLVVEEDGRQRRVTLNDQDHVVAGNRADADLRLDHPTVSRRHAELRPDSDGIWMRDLGSRNGTRVDDVATTESVLVMAGQTIHFGSLRCQVESTDAREIEAAIQLAEPARHHEAVQAGGASTDIGSHREALTLSSGSVRDFVSRALPAIVSLLEARRARFDTSTTPASDRSQAGATTLVQQAGALLFDAFPFRGLEIVARPATSSNGPSDAIVFRAGEPLPNESSPPQSNPTDFTVRAGRLETRARCVPGMHTDAIVPLVELVTRLIVLGLPDATLTVGNRSRRETRPRPPVPLPVPATVDPAMTRLYEQARRVARGAVGVLISGESGTGKEVLAKYIHACSPQGERPWLTLNCAAVAQDLLEAELFGIEKGVATGVDPRAGKFEQADGGTLFLDEIGDMTAPTQARILRVLQEGEVYRLGASSARPARVRVIAATNRDLQALIEEGSFRLDLYHRIADCRFTLPSLRKRRADLPNLAAHFLARATDDVGVVVEGVSKAALDALLAFDWPGNIRQLEREMSRAAMFLDTGELLQTRHLHSEVAGAGAMHGPADDVGSLRARMERVERGIITEALLRHGGKVRDTAQALAVGRTTLYRRLQALGIES